MTHPRLLLIALASIIYAAHGPAVSGQVVSASELLPPALHQNERSTRSSPTTRISSRRLERFVDQLHDEPQGTDVSDVLPIGR